MRVIVVEQPGQFALGERPEPLVGSGEVLVRPLAVGICGSDIDLVQGTRPPAYVRYPIVPGHEWVAEGCCLALVFIACSQVNMSQLKATITVVFVLSVSGEQPIFASNMMNLDVHVMEGWLNW